MCLHNTNSQEHKHGEKSFLDGGASYAHVYNAHNVLKKNTENII